MVQWDKSEVEQKDKDQSTSKATLMMLDQDNNQMIRVSGSMAMSGQADQSAQAQAPAVRRGPYVPPPPTEQFHNAVDMQTVDSASAVLQIQQPKQVSIGSPLEKLSKESLSVLQFLKAEVFKPNFANARKGFTYLKSGTWHKMAIGLAAYLFLIGGAISGAVAGGDRFFKFLSTQMYNMSSDMNSDQTPTRLKTASLKQ